MTTITLDHSLFTGLSQNDVYGSQNTYSVKPQPEIEATQPPKTTPSVTYATRPSVTYQPVTTRAPVTKAPYTVPQTTRRPSTDERLSELSFQCGVPQFPIKNVTSLVVNGKKAMKGQFPWLAAYYHNDVGFSGYICGGSLVSSKVVITAAHCIHDKTDQIIRQPEQAQIFLGRHNLRSENERGYLFSGAIKFIMHHDWNPKVESYDGDIATIVLLRTITFTNLIQPICLWESTQTYADIIDHRGVVAGYGKTESSLSESNVPYWSELPVVDDRTCLDSNSAFLKITSRRTFCAGSRDGT